MKKRYLMLAGILVVSVAAAGCGKKNDSSADTVQAVQATATPAVTEAAQNNVVEMQKTEDEKAILDSVLHFGEETVAEIMIPRVDVIDLSYEASLDEVMKSVIDNNYSRMPVCDRTQDKIKGILYVKDLLPYSVATNPFVCT